MLKQVQDRIHKSMEWHQRNDHDLCEKTLKIGLPGFQCLFHEAIHHYHHLYHPAGTRFWIMGKNTLQYTTMVGYDCCYCSKNIKEPVKTDKKQSICNGITWKRFTKGIQIDFQFILWFTHEKGWFSIAMLVYQRRFRILVTELGGPSGPKVTTEYL